MSDAAELRREIRVDCVENLLRIESIFDDLRGVRGFIAFVLHPVRFVNLMVRVYSLKRKVQMQIQDLRSKAA